MQPMEKLSCVHLLLICHVLFDWVTTVGSTTDRILTCNKNNNQFKIVQFTDTHFGESHISDYLTLNVMSQILQNESPDLVALTGDIISGYAWDGIKSNENYNWWTNLWDKIVSPMIEHDIPWIFIPGNHDTEGEWNATQIMSYDLKKYKNLGSKTQVSASYITPIYSSGSSHNPSPKDTKVKHNYKETESVPVPIANILLIDTGSVSCTNTFDFYGCVEPSQLNDDILSSISDTPTLIYMHIPISDLSFLYRLNDFDQSNMIIGHIDSEIYCFDNSQLNNNSFIEFVKQLQHERKHEFGLIINNIVSIFHGHDHDSDFVYLDDEFDILHGFGRRTGRNWLAEHEMVNRSHILAGSRIFQFDCDNPKTQWQTWIRDYQNNIHFNVSYQDMKILNKKQKNKYTTSKRESCYDSDGDTDNNDICVIDGNDIKTKDVYVVDCYNAFAWKEWKPTVTWMFQHWFIRHFMDFLDIITRIRLFLEL